jgi:hypothetical protein
MNRKQALCICVIKNKKILYLEPKKVGSLLLTCPVRDKSVFTWLKKNQFCIYTTKKDTCKLDIPILWSKRTLSKRPNAFKNAQNSNMQKEGSRVIGYFARRISVSLNWLYIFFSRKFINPKIANINFIHNSNWDKITNRRWLKITNFCFNEFILFPLCVKKMIKSNKIFNRTKKLRIFCGNNKKLIKSE